MRLNKYQKSAIVSAIMDDVPGIDTVARAKKVNAEILKAMSPAVRKLAKTHPNALRTNSVKYADPNREWGYGTVIGDVDDDTIRKIIEPFEAEAREYEEMRRRLKATIEGCTTLKQLKDSMPEFAKYFPTETEPTKNLPVVTNLVTDLMKLGWPKTKAA